ncbi:MAG: SEC-C motif-containing protein [Halieaceae bacterium]
MNKKDSETPLNTCLCGHGESLQQCCSRFISEGALPETAEQLMRSRYTAFALGDEAYLLDTWHPDTRPSRVRLDPRQRWLGLSIRATEAGGLDAVAGTVEFVARYKIDGKGHRLHEISRFEKIAGRWYYLDGEHR